MNTIHLALISLLVERDDVDGGNAIHLLQNAETNVLNVAFPEDLLTPETRARQLNSPINQDMIDNLIIHASQNGARDIFRS